MKRTVLRVVSDFAAGLLMAACYTNVASSQSFLHTSEELARFDALGGDTQVVREAISLCHAAMNHVLKHSPSGRFDEFDARVAEVLRRALEIQEPRFPFYEAEIAGLGSAWLASVLSDRVAQIVAAASRAETGGLYWSIWAVWNGLVDELEQHARRLANGDNGVIFQLTAEFAQVREAAAGRMLPMATRSEITDDDRNRADRALQEYVKALLNGEDMGERRNRDLVSSIADVLASLSYVDGDDPRISEDFARGGWFGIVGSLDTGSLIVRANDEIQLLDPTRQRSKNAMNRYLEDQQLQREASIAEQIEEFKTMIAQTREQSVSDEQSEPSIASEKEEVELPRAAERLTPDPSYTTSAPINSGDTRSSEQNNALTKNPSPPTSDDPGRTTAIVWAVAGLSSIILCWIALRFFGGVRHSGVS